MPAVGAKFGRLWRSRNIGKRRCPNEKAFILCERQEGRQCHQPCGTHSAGAVAPIVGSVSNHHRNLRIRRAEPDIIQEEVALRTGLPQAHLSGIERENRNVSSSMLVMALVAVIRPDQSEVGF